MKLKRIAVYIGLLFILFVLQCSVFGKLRLAGVMPDLCLVLILSLAYFRGSSWGVVFGFLTGLLYDLFSGYMIGVSCLIFLLLGFAAGKCNKDYFDYNFDLKVPLLLIGAGDFLYNLYMYAVSFLLFGDTKFLYYLRHIMLPAMIYTVLAGALLYRVLFLIEQKLSTDERKADGYFVS